MSKLVIRDIRKEESGFWLRQLERDGEILATGGIVELERIVKREMSTGDTYQEIGLGGSGSEFTYEYMLISWEITRQWDAGNTKCKVYLEQLLTGCFKELK